MPSPPLPYRGEVGILAHLVDDLQYQLAKGRILQLELIHQAAVVDQVVTALFQATFAIKGYLRVR